MRVRQRGFTLVELMIVVAVVAILAAIALPSYRNQVIKANRSDAQQFMQDAVIREQQVLLDLRSYVSVSGGNTNFSGINLTVPLNANKNYTFGVDITKACASDGTATGAAFATPGFTVTAVPTTAGGQSTDGNLCIDSLGNKFPATKW